MRIIVTLLAGSLALVAQPTPHIAAVVSAADFEPGVALGGIGTIFGSGMSDAIHHYLTIPYPTKLGNTDVFFCLAGKITQFDESKCQALRLIFVSPGQINFLMFDVLPPLVFACIQNPALSCVRSIVVRVNGVIDDGASSGNSFGTEIYWSGGPLTYEPRIFSAGYDCFIDTRFKDANRNCGLTFTKPPTNAADRGVVTDQLGRVLSSSNPARIGQYYTIWLTGLGIFVNGKPPQLPYILGSEQPVVMRITNVPVYGYTGDTWFIADLSFIGPSPQFPGLYQINFGMPTQIAGGGGSAGYPPLFPCGDYNWEVSLNITQGTGLNQQSANLIQIPIMVKNGDVTCAAN